MTDAATPFTEKQRDPTEHPPPNVSTIKFLYAHAFQCAFPRCSRTLYRLDAETGARTLNSRICHINARREGGPRWDPNQSAEENRARDNLVLMCIEHASIIDDSAAVADFPAELLREWKAKQLEEHDRLSQGWNIDKDMATEAANVSFSGNEVVVISDTIQLGGSGGNAPGAGGGGGGAIGRNPRGGRGGDGGQHRTYDGEYALPRVPVPPEMDLGEHLRAAGLPPDFIPGAGGGGGGAVGEDARAGDGGGGGHGLSAAIDVKRLRTRGFTHCNVRVGEPGSGSNLPGHFGQNSEDSLLEFCSADGAILETLRIPGGVGGKSGASYLPEGVQEISREDVVGGFRVTTLMPANAMDARDGLMFILGAGWMRCPAFSLPQQVVWLVLVTARWNHYRIPAASRGIFLSIFDPAGRETSSIALTIPAEQLVHRNLQAGVPIGTTLDAFGTWTLVVHSGGFLLSRYEIEVTASPQ